MTTKSNSEHADTPASDFLNQNDPAGNQVDVAAEENLVVVKKKSATRKKVGTSSVPKAKNAPVKRSRSTKIDGADSSSSAPVMKAFWGVFNPMMVQVAQYSYAEEAEARQAAADLTEKKKAPHFVQPIKKVI